MTPAQAQLQELFQASQNLPNAYCELGRIQLGLGDLQRIARSRCSSKRADAKAHYLLAGSGFNAEQIVSEISSLEFESQRQALATGVERYLTSKKQDSVYQSISKLVEAATSEFDAQMSKKLAVDWNSSRKRQIFDTQDKPQKAVRPSRYGKVLLGDLPSKDVPAATLQKISSYSAAWFPKGDKAADRLEQCQEVARRWDSSSPQLADTWAALSVLGGATKLNDILVRSRHALELQYRQYVEEEINLRRKDAKLGGVPSPFNKIRVFVDLKYKNDSNVELINKTPIWAQLYFLVRCGYRDEAVQLLQERKDIFDLFETSFQSYFLAWASGTSLTPSYQQLISSDYASSFRANATFDPFKQALYKIIGRCDLSRKSIKATTTTEDWLWLQTYLASPGTDYSPKDLQQVVWKAGASNFEPSGTNPGKYFNLLVLVGLYEQAVEYLHEHDEVSAVHFAVAFNEAKLLSLQTEESDKLLKDNKLNLALALGRYTRLFRKQEPRTAADYLALIASSNRDWAMQALQELVIESRLFVDLLGDPLAPRKGYIQLAASVTEFRQKLVLPAAEKLYQDGRVTDAIVLYYIGEDYAKVVSMTSALVSQTLTSTPLGQTVGHGEQIEESVFHVDHPIDIARKIQSIQVQHPLVLQSISPEDKLQITLLLQVADAMNLLSRGEYEQCFATIDSTGLLPTYVEPDFQKTRELANQFSQYSPSMAQLFPHLLEMVLVSCVHIVKNGAQLSAQYRSRAGNCIAFAGLIQYYMPANIYSRLSALEGELGA